MLDVTGRIFLMVAVAKLPLGLMAADSTIALSMIFTMLPTGGGGLFVPVQHLYSPCPSLTEGADA